MSAKKILVREEDGNTSLVNSQSGSGSVTGTTDDASPSFTGSIPTAAVDEATSGVGFESDPVYGSITTTGNFMAAKDQYAGFWFLTATQAPCLIVGNDATMGALGSPLSLTVFGPLPPTLPPKPSRSFAHLPLRAPSLRIRTQQARWLAPRTRTPSRLPERLRGKSAPPCQTPVCWSVNPA